MEVCGFAFVYDKDLIAMSPEDTHKIDYAQNRMQEIVNEWEEVSKTTGGALVPKKCWAWIIGFEWTADNWKYSSREQLDHTMFVKDEFNIIQSMETLEPSKAKEMLGVRLAPDGNQKEQLEAIKTKMKVFADLIRVGHVTKHEARTSLTMMAMKSLEYMLPAMTLSEKEYADIMKPVLKYYLPKAGINRNIARYILYAPHRTQGFNLKTHI